MLLFKIKTLYDKNDKSDLILFMKIVFEKN